MRVQAVSIGSPWSGLLHQLNLRSTSPSAFASFQPISVTQKELKESPSASLQEQSCSAPATVSSNRPWLPSSRIAKSNLSVTKAQNVNSRTIGNNSNVPSTNFVNKGNNCNLEVKRKLSITPNEGNDTPYPLFLTLDNRVPLKNDISEIGRFHLSRVPIPLEVVDD